MTALTTSVCVDLLRRPDDELLRRRMHVVVTVVVLFCILVFRALNSTSVIDAVYIIASYTYGPLLGLFAFGLFVPRRLHPMERAVPWICVASPLVCYFFSQVASSLWNYHFGYELLLLNGGLTALGLWLSTFIFVKKDVVC